MVPINMPRIAVVGCGWLGLPLAKRLVAEEYDVHGTTTRVYKLELLNRSGIQGHVLHLPEIGKELQNSDLWSCDTFIVNIPPGRRNPSFAALYPSRIRVLLDRILSLANDPRIIFVSSTGVYKNTGEKADETAELVNDKDSVLLQAESMVLRHAHKSVILRMAGLAGEGRHPGNWFAGKVDIPGGNTPINMVHQEDCISIIIGIIKNQKIRGIYNVCADDHPTKQRFYGEMSEQIKVTPPVFQEGLVPYKIVENQKLKEGLGFRYRFSNPMFFSYH